MFLHPEPSKNAHPIIIMYPCENPQAKLLPNININVVGIIVFLPIESAAQFKKKPPIAIPEKAEMKYI